MTPVTHHDPEGCDDVRRVTSGMARHVMPPIVEGLRAVGYRAALVDQGKAAVYARAGGLLGTCTLSLYSTARFAWEHGKPTVWRVHLDSRAARMSARAWTELGLSAPRQAPRFVQPGDRSQRLELSGLACEIDKLAVWLGTWVDARDRHAVHPPCPVQLSRSDELVATYAWTSSAWAAMGAWTRSRNEEQARLRALLTRGSSRQGETTIDA